jgi:hypothetical protein
MHYPFLELISKSYMKTTQYSDKLMSMGDKLGYREADVVVAGGGSGGPIAAIAAARNGMDVLLVEQLGYLGGMFTGGNMIVSSTRPWAGIAKEIFDRLFGMGAAVMCPDDPINYSIFHQRSHSPATVPYDPEMAKIVLFEMCEEAGVKLLLHSYVTGVVTDGSTVKGVTVAYKSGTQVVMGKVICDGTGDGDVAADAGAPFIKGYGPDLQNKMFAMTMLVRLSHVDWSRVGEYSLKDPAWDKAINMGITKGDLPYYKPRTKDMVPYWGHGRPELSHLWYEDGALLWGGTVEDVDGTNADDLSRAEAQCRKQWMSELTFLKKYIPGFQKAMVENSGVSIGVRDTRHIIGEYTYTPNDFANEAEFSDTVAYIVPSGLEVPYGCLVPKTVDGLLVASRCLSATPGQTAAGPVRGVYNNMKSITSCMSYGQAAGTAAALCVREDVAPRRLDVKVMQRVLTEQGALVSREALKQFRSDRKIFREPSDLFSYSGETSKPV